MLVIYGGMIRWGATLEYQIASVLVERIGNRDLAELLAEAIGYEGGFVQSTDNPNGTLRKLIDRITFLNTAWTPRCSLEEERNTAYACFQEAGKARCN